MESCIDYNMILRKGVISCVRKNIYSFRSITVSSSLKSNEDRKNLPSRRLFVDLTERAYLDEKLSRSGRRPFEATVEKPIVVKNFFVAEVDGEVVQYPNIVPEELVDDLQRKKSQLSDFFQKNAGNLDKSSVYDELKKLNVFGYNVPKKYNGQGFSNTYRTLMSENETQNIAIAKALNAHRLACHLIFEQGTTEQVDKYLSKLATGELIATVAFQEWNQNGRTDMNTQAEYDEDDREWCLNGKVDLMISEGKNI